MNSPDSHGSMNSIADVLACVRKKNVKLWSENGQLHYRAPKGVLAQEEIERLKISKGQIVALLEQAAGVATAEPKFNPRPRPDRAPLTFSQLAHWHLYRLSERRSLRQIASATRLHCRLSINALRESIAAIVRRHDALRTRIVVRDGVPTQEITALDNCELRVDDLTTLSESLREIEVNRRIEQFILEPVDVAVGPLFGLRLLRLRDDEHVLIAAMEHMISDAFSMNILLRELFTAYTQNLTGRPFSLPPIPVQFADFAVWVRDGQKSWFEKHGEYWAERLAGCQRVRFPAENTLPSTTCLGWGTVPLRIAKDLKTELREWCRRRQTTLVLGVLTAYVGLTLRWCNVSEAVIQYQTDGRTSSQLENTIGYFASSLYLRISLLECDSFVDLLNRVTEEYCKAYQHADFSYMEAQVPRPEIARNTAFNWVPQGRKVDLPDLDGSEDAIKCSPVSFAHPMLKSLERDNEPMILLYDGDDEIVGGMHFPLNRFSIDTMERFGRNFLLFVKALVRQPDENLKDILLL